MQMIELLSLLGGFLTSAIPYAFKAYQDAKDKAHEITMTHMSIQNTREAGNFKLAEIAVNNDMQQFKIRSSNMFKGNKITDILNAGVPAVYAYAFLFLYFMVQVVYWYILLDAPISVRIDEMWTTTDQVFMNYILGHFFGKSTTQRVMRY